MSMWFIGMRTWSNLKYPLSCKAHVTWLVLVDNWRTAVNTCFSGCYGYHGVVSKFQANISNWNSGERSVIVQVTQLHDERMNSCKQIRIIARNGEKQWPSGGTTNNILLYRSRCCQWLNEPWGSHGLQAFLSHLKQYLEPSILHAHAQHISVICFNELYLAKILLM